METKEKIKVWIIDDEKAYRDSIKKVLSDNEKIWVHNEFDSKETLLEALKSPFLPDVCLVDIKLGNKADDQSGLECCQAIKEKNPNTHVIIMTAYPNADIFAESKRIGADYIEKNTRGEILLDKIISSSQVEGIISSRKHNNKEIIDMAGLSESVETFLSSMSKLSDKEKEVLKLKMKGLHNEEIGELLNISDQTVKSHLRNIKIKKNVDCPNLWDFVKL